MIISIDPGLSGGCGMATHDPIMGGIDVSAVYGNTEKILFAVSRMVACRKPLTLVVEYPVKRPNRRDAWHAVDLLRDLLEAIKKDLKPQTYVKYKPEEWKGTVAKEIHQRRVLNAFPMPIRDHNAIDAAALLLFHLNLIDKAGRIVAK